MRSGKNARGSENNTTSAGEKSDKELLKLSKKELLQIMLEQSKEIDRLRAKVSELEASLDKQELEFESIGTLAEASVYMTNLFKEADKAVGLYIKNIRRKYE